MNNLALTLRNSYQAIDKKKLAQVEENISAGEAAPTHNTLKTSPAQSAGSTPPPAGLPSGAPAAGPQQQLAPQQGAMPPAAPPSDTQQAGVGEQNPQAVEAPAPLPNVTPLSTTPSRGGKGRRKTSADREQLTLLLKKQAEGGWFSGWGGGAGIKNLVNRTLGRIGQPKKPQSAAPQTQQSAAPQTQQKEKPPAPKPVAKRSPEEIQRRLAAGRKKQEAEIAAHKAKFKSSPQAD